MSLAIGLPLLAITVVLIIFAPRFKSEKVGCLIGILAVATIVALLPVLFYLEVYGPILLIVCALGLAAYQYFRKKKKRP